MADESRPLPAPPSASLVAYNPYAPPVIEGTSPVLPAAVASPDVSPFGGEALKWVYLGAEGVRFVAVVAGILVKERTVVVVAQAFVGLAYLFGALIALVWLVAAWSTRPFPRAHRDVSAGGAVGRLFIPFYGLYWMFAANLELVASVEEDPFRSREGGDALGLTGIVRCACALQILVPLIIFFSAPASVPVYAATVLGGVRSAAWILFLFKWERRRALAVATR